MGRNIFSIIVVLGVGIAAIFAVTYYLGSDKEDEPIALEKDTAEVQKKVKEKQGQDLYQKNTQEDAHGARAFGEANDHFDGMKKDSPKESPRSGQPEQPAAQNQENSANAKNLDQAVKKQAAVVYDDLFKELSLPEEQNQKLLGNLSKTMKAHAELAPKLMDPNVPVDEVLRQQEKLSQEQSDELKGFLSDKDQDTVKQYQRELPKKMQKKQLMGLVDHLGFDGADKENIERVLDRAVDKMETPKSLGQMSRQDIMDMREKFGNAKASDPNFMKAMIDNGDKEVKNLLKNLEELPKDQYEKIKEQLEAPLKMMRQKAMQQAPDSR